MRYINAKYHHKGVALVIVLWMLALLTLLAASYSHTMRTETTLTRHLLHSAQAKALAEAGIWQGITELLRPVNEQIWIPDGSTNTFELDDNTIKVRLIAETGKIDLNTAKPELIQALFASIDTITIEQAETLSDAVQDWRDKDSLVRLYGAEDEDYENQGYAYGAKDGSLNTINEIQQVMGMTSDIYNKIRPAITIYSKKATVDTQLAPMEVLRILPNMTDASIDELLERRSQEPETGTLIGADLKRRYNTAGKAFTVYSEGTIGNTTAHISAIVLLKRNKKLPFSLLVWQEDEIINKTETNIENLSDNS